jgi:hypothetical protein
MQNAATLKMKRPHTTDLSTLQTWLGSEDGGNHFLVGSEASAWNDDSKSDMISLFASAHSDTLAQQLWNRFLPWYHNTIGRRRKPYIDPELGQVWEYQPESFTLAGNILCVLLSFAIPTGSIFALYYVRSMTLRLLMMAAFILLFAIMMMFMVGSRREQVFAATAAFAAIQVVFVGGVNIIQQS